MIDCQSIDIPDDNGVIKVSYVDIGSSENIVICLHGIQGSKNSFEPLIASRLSEKLRVIAIDLPGFGDSGIPNSGSYDLRQQAERIVTFIDMLDIDKFHMLGHSLGGMLGVLLLELIPKRVLSFISLEGNLRGIDCGETRRVAAMSLEEFKSTRLPQLQATTDPYLKIGLSKVNPNAFYETSQSVVEWAEREKLLDIICKTEVPVLFVRGGNSQFITEPKGACVQNVMVSNEDHFSLGRSEKVFEVINNFLHKLNEEQG